MLIRNLVENFCKRSVAIPLPHDAIAFADLHYRKTLMYMRDLIFSLEHDDNS